MSHLSLPGEFLEHRRLDATACVVLDVRLPGLSGLDLQRELVRTEASVPIIFITGHGDIPMSVRAIKEGAVEFLAKNLPNQWCAGAKKVDSLATVFASQVLAFRYHQPRSGCSLL